MIVKDITIHINNEKSINISEMDIPEKGIIGISGSSGTGKTTLLNHIHHGDLSSFFGNDISYMTQENLFFDHMNIKQNIKFQLSLVDKELDLNNSLLMDFHILPLLKKRPKHLSVGEKQRVNFVIQMMRESSVVLLDEPTASLNDQYICKIKDCLVNLKERCLIVLTSHNPELFEICDNIYTFENHCLIPMKKYKTDSYLMPKNKKYNFSYVQFTLRKWNHDILRNLPILFVISLVCTGLSLMHSIKYQMLESQKDMLQQINQNEILLVNTKQPYSQTGYSDCLPINNRDWEKLNEIDNIKCYPLYYISNTDNESMKRPLHLYQNDEEVGTYNQLVCIVPYFGTSWLEQSLVSGTVSDKGVYINNSIRYFINRSGQDFTNQNISIALDVLIPTHYSVNEMIYSVDDDFVGDPFQSTYSWETAGLFGDVVSFQHEIDGFVSEDYHRSSGAIVDIYVPYQMLIEMVEEKQVNEEKIFNQSQLKPYTFGAAYIQVENFEDVEEVSKDIQKISPTFDLQYEYHNQEEALKVFQNFKNEIDLFEYAAIIFSIILAYGYWKVRKNTDMEIYHKLKMFLLTQKQYLYYYFIDTFINMCIILMMTLALSSISFAIVLSLGENLVYDVNATIAALLSSCFISVVMKIFVERKMLYDRN